MKNHFLKSLLVTTLLAFHLTAMAEDIDLFVGATPTTTDVPNVLIILDNTANWTSPFVNEKAALVSVFNALPVDKFRVGLMLFTETGSPNNNVDGGYVRAAIRLMNATNKPLYSNLINGFDVGNDKSNGGKAGKTMAEAYFYFKGLAPVSGNSKVKTDYTGNVTAGAYLANSRAVWALTPASTNALPSFAGSPYTSPIVASCAKNYIIYISNGAVQDNASDTTTATNLLAAAGGNTTLIGLSPTGSQTNVADEWARFMKKSSAGITSYTVDVNKVTTGQGPGWTALLKSIARQSDGKYFDVTSSGTQILDTLTNIFSEIQATNSVFASVSLPVSVNTQGTFLNQVFIGMFRPDKDAYPRWNGNLKQYKLGLNGITLELQDADGASAINTSTGFITECARSFWTPTVLDSYWAFRPQGACLTANSDISNTPDGNIVEKGAQAYQLRSTTTRTVKTCSTAACTALADFNSTTATQALLGAASTAERDALINWQRGLDVDDEDGDTITLAEMRPSAHGDVVHSRPVAINYGTTVAPDVAVFYGGNDGILRAVNGNRTASMGGVAAGSELWAFVAPEFYPKIKRIRDNTTTISFPGHTTGTPTPQPKDYGVDGPVTAYKDATRAWIYATMRRGGRALYAFDVTTPASPTLKWKIGCPNAGNDTGCSTDFSDIGQTWSSPKILNATGYGLGASPMLIMGGGYDTCQDNNLNTKALIDACNSSGKGRKIYLMDADTGALLKTFDTDSSVVGDITVVPDRLTGMATYAYAADLGGNVYRISGNSPNTPIGATVPGNWNITKIAALGIAASGATTSDNRKFMFAPDVVDDGSGTFAVLLGSGDREKPLELYTSATAVANRFFMIKDNPTDAAWLSSENATCSGSWLCTASLVAITDATTPSQATLDAEKGWYLALVASEQVVTSAITVFDTVTFSTHRPDVAGAGACSTLGEATVYNLNFRNAAAFPCADDVCPRGETIVGGGLPPSPVAGEVTLDNGTTVPFLIGGSPDSPLQGIAPPPHPSATRPKGRAYWNIKK